MEHDKHFIADIPQKALIVHKNKVLLVQESKMPYAWQLPGGRLNEGEEPVDGLLREIREELSVDIEVMGIFDTFVFKSMSGRNHYLVVYICRLLDLPDTILLDSENKDLKWVRAGEYNNLDPIWPNYKTVLNRFFSE